MPLDMSGFGAGFDPFFANAIHWGPRLLAALAIILVTHFVAKLVERGIARIGTTPVWQRTKMHADTSVVIWSQAGTLGYWLIWLTGFLIALQPLQLGDVVAPLNVLLNQIGEFLPKLIGAAAIMVVGLALSKIARGVAENAVGLLRIDHLLSADGAKLADSVKTRTSFAVAAGTAVQMLVLLPIALAAIDVLGITAVTIPLRHLLATILLAVPHVIAAGLVLVIAYLIGRWIAAAAENFLSGLGVDEAGQSIGISGDNFSLSRASYHVVLIAVMLFALTEAARLLNFEMVSRIAEETVRLGGRIAFGAALIAAAFVAARIISKLVADNGQVRAGRIAGYAILTIGIAMGLTFMGIATQIVTIAFGAAIAAAAIATAIAFGLGGRQTAHQLLQEWKDRDAMSEKADRPG